MFPTTATPIAGRSIIIALIISLVCIYCSKKQTDADLDAKKPNADFEYDIRNQGVIPDTVDFTSTALNAVEYHWDFGDSTSSTDKNVQHVYEAARSYKVKLVVSNEFGQDSVVHELLLTREKPKAAFEYSIRNPGVLPAEVVFTNKTVGARGYTWIIDNVDTVTSEHPTVHFDSARTYNVKLIAANEGGTDTATDSVVITVEKPVAKFSIALSNVELMPVTLSCSNTSAGYQLSYRWTFGDSKTSELKEPLHNYTRGGIYTIKLVVTNPAGSDSATARIKLSPYPQQYTSFQGQKLQLYAWSKGKVMLLSSSKSLNRTAMFKWLDAMNAAYNYYRKCTGRDPNFYEPTYIDGHTTIADVESTCGAGCGYLGFTGIEIQRDYFKLNYDAINSRNEFDQLPFFEFGRNFWFYFDQLAYKQNDPVASGYAVFMRFISMEKAGVRGAPYYDLTFDEFKNSVIDLIDQYLADPSLTWENTLGYGMGVPGGFGSANDLFASFCFRLRRDFGGDRFVEKLWYNAGQRPLANTTQQAVDNFFIAACQSANKNLTQVFQTWKWPLSQAAINEVANYP